MQINNKGFTLIELVLVIVMIGILALLSQGVIVQPFKTQQRFIAHTELMVSLDSATRQLSYELHDALPNSVIVSPDGLSVTFLHVNAVGRYRSELKSDGTGDVLLLNSDDNGFDVIGGLNHFSDINTTLNKVVIYNLGINELTLNAYNDSNTLLLQAGSTLTHLVTSSKTIKQGSPDNRFFIIDKQITYSYNPGLLEFHRSEQLINTSTTVTSIVAKHISSVHFTYQTGLSSRYGLLALQIAATQNNDSVTISNQFSIANTP